MHVDYAGQTQPVRRSRIFLKSWLNAIRGTLHSYLELVGCELIAALFDLIRNGQAHQYQQIRVELTDKKSFQFSLTGAEHQLYLHHSFAEGRPVQHLAAQTDENGDIWVTVRTDILFLDIRDSIRAAKVLDRKLSMQYLERTKFYKFDASALNKCLKNGGHNQ